MAMDAYPLSPNSKLISMAKNFSCHLEMNDISFFISKKYGNNFYFFDDPLGPVIVAGETLLTALSPAELKAVLFYTLTLIHKKEGRLRVWINLAFFPFYLFFSLQNKGRYLRLFSNFFLSPLNYLKDYLLTCRKKDSHLLLKKELLSALFKIRQLDALCETNILERIVRNFSISFNNNNRFEWSLAEKNIFYPSSLRNL